MFDVHVILQHASMPSASPELPHSLMVKGHACLSFSYIIFTLEKQVNTPVCLLSHFSCVQLFATLWTVVPQPLPPMGFSRQEYWDGLPCPPPGDLPNPGMEPVSYVSCIGRQILYH